MNELNIFCFLSNLFVAILCGVLMPMIPGLTRKSFLFGVKIPSKEQNAPKVKAMKKRYTIVCVIGSVTILALSIVQFHAAPDLSLIAMMYIPFLLIAVYLAAFVPNWKRALILKEKCGWQVSSSVFAETNSSHSRGNLSELPWGWYIVGLMIVVVTAVIVLVCYPALPNKIPIHFDIKMNADSWSDKSVGVVLLLPILNLFMLFFMWLTGVLTVKAKLQVDAENPALSFAQHHIYRRRFGHYLGLETLSIVVLFAILGFATLWQEFRVPFWLILCLIIVPAVPLCVFSVRAGQGGCKLNPKNVIPKGSTLTVQTGVVPCDDDKHWLIGMFYHNPKDPACVVEDRFGNGIGFNYARFSVKIGVAISLMVLVAGYTWITAWAATNLLMNEVR
ncbi:DUF1648 domain-containing protein [Lachnospiraceae bacterium ZAX-1]